MEQQERDAAGRCSGGSRRPAGPAGRRGRRRDLGRQQRDHAGEGRAARQAVRPPRRGGSARPRSSTPSSSTTRSSSGRYAGGPVGDLRLHPDLEPAHRARRAAGLGVGAGRPVHPGRRPAPAGPAQRWQARLVAELTPPGSRPRPRSRSSGRSARPARAATFVPPCGPGLRRDPARRNVRTICATCSWRSAGRGSPSTRSIPSTAPGSSRSPWPPRTRSGRPTRSYSCGRPIRATSRAPRHARLVLPQGARRGRRQRRPRAPVGVARRTRTCSRGGSQQHGLTDEAAAFTAGILQRLPALLAVGAPRSRAICG